jgi:predicted alpha/beta superfamily hydrolase
VRPPAGAHARPPARPHTRAAGLVAALLLVAAPALARDPSVVASPPAPLAIGETFTLESRVLGETRRINVYLPPAYGDSATARLPVLYMPDGGIAEDFLHVAGLVQVSTGNGTMRPFILVGIENTQRRRDLTGPTDNPEDRKIAPRVGGSAAFRAFLRTELIPLVEARYRTTRERAIMGESLAGLFVVETLFSEPDLFDTYVAFDPSVWWNDGRLAAGPGPGWSARTPRVLYLAASSEDRGDWIAKLAARLTHSPPPNLRVQYQPMPEEKHATIYHPAALLAVRRLFPPVTGH